MTRDVAKYVRNCQTCLLNKPRNKTKQPLKVVATPQKPFDVVVIDTVGPLPTTDFGNKYAVTAICELTKYLVTIAIPNKEANTVARAVFENVILIYGPMKSIKTDLGTEYKNEIFKELSKMLEIDHKFSTAYHETLGTIERNHRSLNEYLRAYLADANWDIHLKYFTFCHNISYNANSDAKYTPFELIFSKKCNMPSDLTMSIEPIYDFENFIKVAKKNLQVAHKAAIGAVEKSKIESKKFYDRKANPIILKKGDKVLVKIEPYNKLKNIFKGPYSIIKLDEENVTIKIDEKETTIHKNRVVRA